MNAEMPSYQLRGNGKLLFTGEYFVLDGVLALAAPTKKGQRMLVWEGGGQPGTLLWTSYDDQGQPWFRAQWEIKGLELVLDWYEGEDVSKRLEEILAVAIKLNPSVATRLENTRVETHLEFPRIWGLGTSSTLLYCLAEWLELDAWTIMDQSFGGSGYDLACAGVDLPILYRRTNEGPHFLQVHWYPDYTDQCYFVFLEQKQNSREGIAHYRAKAPFPEEIMNLVEGYTLELTQAKTAEAAQELIKAHEALLAEQLDMQPIGITRFPDFDGATKSLGAWGGDFAWAISNMDEAATRQYFNERGYPLVLRFEEMFDMSERDKYRAQKDL